MRTSHGILAAVAASVIVLSACSSAVVADSRTNTYHGLAGSLLRAGARAIVGSRWPVDDAAAATLMSAFHERLREGCSAADLALHAARAAMRADGARIEDWAAFGYLGVV